nr:hypothetical protein CFP56_76324 [Quercus suber]
MVYERPLHIASSSRMRHSRATDLTSSTPLRSPRTQRYSYEPTTASDLSDHTTTAPSTSLATFPCRPKSRFPYAPTVLLLLLLISFITCVFPACCLFAWRREDFDDEGPFFSKPAFIGPLASFMASWLFDGGLKGVTFARKGEDATGLQGAKDISLPPNFLFPNSLSPLFAHKGFLLIYMCCAI